MGAKQDGELRWVEDFLAEHLSSPDRGNFVDAAVALRPELSSMRMYDRALVGVADAADACFEACREEGVVGRHFIPPAAWLPEAASVISVFLTFTEQVSESNAELPGWPSDEWLHARIEGQKYIDGLMNALKEELERRGYPSAVPSSDPRFASVAMSHADARLSGRSFTSVWSERHVAYACGLGTFGLAKGIITELGAAGRLGSVVTTLSLTPTPRRYTGVYDYCTMCGVCAVRCPAEAIDPVTGKDHAKCSAFLGRTLERYRPRYGCGKCQVSVPCQNGVPAP